MYDVKISGGLLVDGTGDPPRPADVAVVGDTIVAVGPELPGDAARTIDASGQIVTPGFVDVHTHYDGQATWDDLLEPSSGHGVTTVVMGNCGVGFAPVRPGTEDWLIQLMEGVEDIPGAALSEGIAWGWESFGDYLDALDDRRWAIDIGTQVPHGAVRAYVMGERGARNEPADADETERMGGIVADAVASGALGVSTSRTLAHKAMDGEPVPGTFAATDELFALGRGLRDGGGGVFELAPVGSAGEDVVKPRSEVDWMRRLSAEIGQPVSFALLQVPAAPDLWRELMDVSLQAAEEGAELYPQVAGRPFGLLVGWQTSHPFGLRPTYRSVEHLSIEERVERLRDPGVRAAILSEPDGACRGGMQEGVGAHCGLICDASMPTTMLSHWTRDRQRGERLPLEWVVRKQTHDTAALFGLNDRGVVAAGKRADLNVIDYSAINLGTPRLVHDLPAGGRRLPQHADGYTATIVAGEQTRADGLDTGARPGRLVRGRRAA